MKQEHPQQKSSLLPGLYSLTLALALKNGVWETTFLLGRPILRSYVSFREGKGEILSRVRLISLKPYESTQQIAGVKG